MSRFGKPKSRSATIKATGLSLYTEFQLIDGHFDLIGRSCGAYLNNTPNYADLAQRLSDQKDHIHNVFTSVWMSDKSTAALANINDTEASPPPLIESILDSPTSAAAIALVSGQNSPRRRLFFVLRDHLQNFMKTVIIPFVTSAGTGLRLVRAICCGSKNTMNRDVWKCLRLYRACMKKTCLLMDRTCGVGVGGPSNPPSSVYISKEFYRQVYPIIVGNLGAALCECTNILRASSALSSASADAKDMMNCCVVFNKIAKRLYWYKSSTNHVYAVKDITANYHTDWELQYLSNTTEYYRLTAQTWMTTMSVPEYVKAVEGAHIRERELVAKYLLTRDPESVEAVKDDSKGTWVRVQALLDEVLVSRQESFIFEHETTGLRALFGKEDRITIAQIQRVYSRIPNSVQRIANLYKEYVISRGMTLVRQQATATTAATATVAAEGSKPAAAEKPTTSATSVNTDIVKELSVLNVWSSRFVREVFLDRMDFQTAAQAAFVSIVNAPIEGAKMSTVEVIVTHIDNLMQGKGDKLSVTEQETAVLDAMKLFRYVAEKDVFGEVYRQQLSKRLVNRQSASTDLERMALAQMKIDCGLAFTSKMENMLNDITTASMMPDTITKYNQYAHDVMLLPKGIDFNTQVLTMGSWPSFTDVKAKLPADIQDFQNAYDSFYQDQAGNSRKKLHWIMSAGTAMVRAKFGKSVYELTVSPLQAIILDAFNTFDKEASLADVCTTCGMDIGVVRRMMHSLACGKAKLLTKSPASNSIKDDDKFVVNDAFTSPMKRLRIPVPNVVEPVAGQDRERVEEGRIMVLEAAIVRIMKSRKVLSHTELMTEVIRHIHTFSPEPKMIKRRIETLIEREYLERSETETNTYHYLA